MGRLYVSETGGVATALGLRYQYLSTIEAALRQVAQGNEDVVLCTEDSVEQAVDYSLAGPDGHYLEVAQVKATGTRRVEMSPGAAIAILEHLIRVDADRYRLLTNRPLSPGVQALATVLDNADGASSRDFVVRLKGAVARSPDAASRLSALDERGWQRLPRCRVEYDSRNLDVVYGQIREQVFRQRRSHAGGIGAGSSSLLLNHLIAEVFQRSAQPQGRSLSVGEFRDLLMADSLVVAQAFGRYDWGRPRGPLPPRPSVERSGLVDELADDLAVLEMSRRPRRCVLTGLSGIGKSSLSAEYAHRAAALYDWILWVNAESDSSIRQTLQLVLDAPTATWTDEVVQDALRDHFASSPATWLLILDNAPDSRTLRRWLPAIGRVDILASSTNRNGWAQWKHIPVGPMKEDEATALVVERLLPDDELPDADQRARIATLVRTLECWPLALELACAHLSTSGRGLAFTDDYLRELALAALSNPELRPEGYESHPSLVAAVLHAIDELVSQAGPNLSPALLTLSAMAFLPARAVPTNCAMRAGALLGEWLAGREAEVAEVVPDVLYVDAVVRNLGRASLVNRSPGDPADPLDDTLTTNEIVLEVLRERLPREAAIRAVLADAFVVDAELVPRLESDEYGAVRRLLPSALSVIGYAYPRLIAAGLATLMGNLSTFFMHIEDFASARNLLRAEARILDDLGFSRATRLHVKIFIGLTLCAGELADDVEEVVAEARLAVDAVLAVAARPDSNLGDVASLHSLQQLLHGIDERHPGNDELHALADQVNELMVTHAVAEHPAIALSKLIQRLIEDSQAHEAVVLLERALRDDSLPASFRCGFMASLIEGYVRDERPDQATEQITTALAAIDRAALSHRTATIAILNAWFWALLRMLFYPATDGHRTFLEAVASALTSEDLATAENRFRYAVYHAGNMAMMGEAEDAKQAIAEAASLRVAPSVRVRSGEALDETLTMLDRIVQLRLGTGGGRPLVAAGVGLRSLRSVDEWLLIGRQVKVLLGDDDFAKLRMWAGDQSLHGQWTVYPDGTVLAVLGEGGGAVAMLWIAAWEGSLGLLASGNPSGARADFGVPTVDEALHESSVVPLLIESQSGRVSLVVPSSELAAN